MISQSFVGIIKKFSKICKKNKIDFMFTGGIAVSVWGNPRATYDIDGIIGISIAETKKFLDMVVKGGFVYDKKTPIKSIQNLSFITLKYPYKKSKIYVDIFIAKDEYLKESLSRKKEIKFYDTKISIIAPEDLILYKLFSGRNKDIEDIHDILFSQKGKLNIEYMKKWAENLGISYKLKDELKSVYYKTYG